MLRTLLGLSLVGLLACPSSEEPTRRSAAPPPAAKPRAQAPPPEVALSQLEKIWEWPPDKGEAPDIATDFRECQQRLGSRRQVLAALKQAADCMNEKGWQRKAAS